VVVCGVVLVVCVCDVCDMFLFDAHAYLPGTRPLHTSQDHLPITPPNTSNSHLQFTPPIHKSHSHLEPDFLTLATWHASHAHLLCTPDIHSRATFDRCEVRAGWFCVWSFMVLFLSCRVLCCCGGVLVVSCVVLFLLCVCVCVTCFFSYAFH